MPPDKPMFSRDELLGGLPARRASTVLFAIEGTTARLVAASRINRAAFVGERTVVEREQDFLKAMATGGALPNPPTIADLERFAPDWAALVPEIVDGRAAIARLLGSKYRFRREDVPRLRAAFGLDDPAVEAAFERLHHVPLATIYTEQIPIGDRIRWRLARFAARFDRLPPFWIAYFIAVTETLGEGIMTVPLALAGLGPLPGVILLLALGGVNLITMGAISEAITRNGSMRYGTAYFSRLARELLGRAPSSTLSIVLGLFNVVTLFVYFLGFGSVLTGATGIPLGVWIVLLFAVNVFVLRNESLDDTIASAVIIGLVNLLLVVAIVVIAMPQVDMASLAYSNVPIVDGRPIEPAVVGLVLGVLLTAFFGHTAAANASKLVLTLEPSGRSLLWGNLAALATIIILYCFAAVAFLGVLGPAPLLATNGTAITPLADAIGPAVSVLGSLYVVLAIGIGSLYVTLGLYNQVIEMLPRPSPSGGGLLAHLSRTRRGRLMVGLAPAAAVCLGLEAIVLAGKDDFVGTVALAGVLVVPLITGVFPMLLILAARRKGEYVPERVVGILGHPVVVVTLLGFFVAAVAAHGLVIWDDPAPRAAALIVAAFAAVLIAWVWRSGGFQRRAVVELRVDRRSRQTTLSVTTAGKAVIADAAVDATAGAAPTASIPGGDWRELRIWPHEVTPDGWSIGLAVDVALGEEGASVRHHLAPSAEPLLIAFDGRPTTVAIRLDATPGGD